ncbi:hypothetical protein GCM10022228_01170 [Halomonas cibimaris]|uniref:Uncharacterized protein n=1 Tax=Halomonas cibimaris TaxID=657012 RepID=A0ABP7L3Q6_9GAMM
MNAGLKKRAAVLGVLMMTGGLAACEEQGPAEKAGESIDESMEQAGENIEEMGNELQESAEQAAE